MSSIRCPPRWRVCFPKNERFFQRATSFGFFDDFADPGDAVDYGAELDEFSVGVLGNQACDRRLAATRRAPEDAAADITPSNGIAQGTTRSQEMLLPDAFFQSARAHPSGQRLRRSEQRRLCHAGILRATGDEATGDR